MVDTSKYIDYSIVNPADLSRDLQMNVCQRCHLQGVAILKDGKNFDDFRPAMPLTDVMDVFLPEYDGNETQFIMASQAHRLAKNTNSTIALLDAINEEIGNNIFRKGHVSLGFSSALIGSGMIFSTALYERLMASISYVAIEDKMLEFTLLKENIKVSYLDSAFVYDEKVVRQEQFTGQRSRWISNRLYFLKSEAYTSFLKLARLDFDYFDKWLQALIPQKIMLINYVLLFSLASFIFSNNILPVLLLLIILLVTFGISIPKRYYNLRLFNALLGIPFLAYRMMGILLKISKVDPSKFNVTVKEVKS